MNDITTEKFIRLAEAASMVPGRGGRPTANPSTAFRWSRDGVKVGNRRVRLKTWRVGGHILTTARAVADFIAELNPTIDDTPTRTPAERMRASKRAEAELEKMGA